MSGRIKYTKGQKFGKLTFVKDIYSDDIHRKAIFLCHCGKEFVAHIHNVKSGRKKSCGCLWKSTARETHTTHGLSHHPLYPLWTTIKQRCYNPNSKFFCIFGAKGIKVCEEWKNDFKAFYDWAIASGWQEGFKLRIKLRHIGFEPNNCYWITKEEYEEKIKQHLIEYYEKKFS